METKNIVLLTDSYKVTHWKQYPPGTQHVYSYLEARGPGDAYPETCFFGLQYILKEYLEGEVVTKAKVDEAEEMMADHFGDPTIFNREGWDYIVNVHDGRLPVQIKAVPEGTIVPRANVLMTVENTDPKCFWLTNHLESVLMHVWHGTTVATHGRELKGLFLNFLDLSGTPDFVDLKVIDFGLRGVSSVESAGVGGAAHLVNFRGTDNIAGLVLAKKYYKSDMAGYSVPAMEHSTVISWGRSREAEAYANMFNKFPKGTISLVVDSYDTHHAVNMLLEQFRGVIETRDGVVYLRPDSGDPVLEAMNTLHMMIKTFGYSPNAKGFQMLNTPKIKVLIDGQNIDTVKNVLTATHNWGWSVDMFSFGIGGGLLQKFNRDTLRFAYKTSSVTINGEEQSVSKTTRDAWKASKMGRMKLIKDGSVMKTVIDTQEGDDLLVEVFRDGEVLKEYSLDEIRDKAFIF